MTERSLHPKDPPKVHTREVAGSKPAAPIKESSAQAEISAQSGDASYQSEYAGGDNGGSKPRLLDLFCGAGGSAEGYQRAGFYVVGVDHKPQPNYCGDGFVQADALDHPLDIEAFDAIHASPPCQRWTRGQKLRGNDHPDLIGPVREHLIESGLPYAVENVPGAPLHDPLTLCGTMFGLPLYRHRAFECSFPVPQPLHGQHWLPQVKMGRKPGDNEIVQVVGHFSDVQRGREAMGIDWMTQDELREAIPPAYTEHIGRYLMAHLKSQMVAP